MFRNAFLTIVSVWGLTACGEDTQNLAPQSDNNAAVAGNSSTSGAGQRALISNPDGTFTYLASEDCSAQNVALDLNRAYATGDVRHIKKVDDLYQDIFRTIACDATAGNAAKRALFGLNADGAVGSGALQNITWDPTHDAAILNAAARGTIVLTSNAVAVDGHTIRHDGLGVVSSTGNSRHLVLGSNPMRTKYRGFNTGPQMDSFVANAISYLAGREDLATGDLSVVIAQMDDGYYFPDRRATRSWLDNQFGTRVSYNDATTCDGPALSACLAQKPDLLILSQVADEADIPAITAAVAQAIKADVGVLYMHHDGNLKPLGAELIPMLGARYVADNYWRKQALAGFDGTQGYGELPEESVQLRRLIKNLQDDNFNLILANCDDKSCPDESGYKTDFLTPVKGVQSRILGFDKSATDVFASDKYRLDQGLVLLADMYRQDVRFPMDKATTPKIDFLRAMYADHVVHTTRATAPVQADMGNFSRSDFSHVTAVTRDVILTARQHYGAAGVYAIPGQTVRVTRLDDADVTTHVRINLLRSGATHEFQNNGYKRPKHLSSADMPIAAGETLIFTSPHGGPIQIRFDDKDMETQFRFENVGEHAVWRGEDDDADFAAKLIEGDFDWAELMTPGFQVHSTLSKMRETVNHPTWPSAAQVAEATERHLYNLPHVLAGLQGSGIDIVPEIHDFANANGLTIDTLTTVKHMNADQANCGYGCSGNPYDAYWSFNPIGHGDIHELGHGLERSRFRYTGQPGHTGTNPYSYYSKSKFYAETGDADNLGCQSLPYEKLFDTVQGSRLTTNPAQHMREANLTGWNDGAAINLQIMMAAQDLGLLENGYHLLARQHIIERNFNRADNNDDAWADQKDGLGFGAFTREAARALSNNDWNLIALSHALNRDMSDYLEMWGFELTTAAKAAVAGKIKFPTEFYVASPTAHCTGFPTQKLPVDGKQDWPLAAQTSALQTPKPPTYAAGHICSEDDVH